MHIQKDGPRGFTLIELLVVLAIIGVLLGLLLPAVQRAREGASRLKCQNNLKQFGLALHHYHGTHGAFPAGSVFLPSTNWGADKGSWIVYALPFLEEQGLFQQLPNLYVPDFDSISAAEQAGVLPRAISARLRCPSDGFDFNQPVSNYAGNIGPACLEDFCHFAPFQYMANQPALGWTSTSCEAEGSDLQSLLGMFSRGHREDAIRIEHVTDGTSTTFLLGEALPSQDAHMLLFGGHKGWYGAHGAQLCSTIVPLNYPIDEKDRSWCGSASAGPAHALTNNSVSWGFRSRHPGGANFCMVDGSVHFIGQDIDYKAYQFLGCRFDGNTVNAPD